MLEIILTTCDEKREEREGGGGLGTWSSVRRLINIRTDFRAARGYTDQTLPPLSPGPGHFFTTLTQIMKRGREKKGDIFLCPSVCHNVPWLPIMPRLQGIVHIIIRLTRFTAPAHPEKCTNCKPRSV